jgi:hypothetical protein
MRTLRLKQMTGEERAKYRPRCRFLMAVAADQHIDMRIAGADHGLLAEAPPPAALPYRSRRAGPQTQIDTRDAVYLPRS